MKSTQLDTSYELLSGDLLSGTVVDSALNNNLLTLQGGNVNKGVVITLIGSSDASGTLSFRTPDGTIGDDNNGIASGFILTQIPEPSTGLLGLLGLGFILRRRRD